MAETSQRKFDVTTFGETMLRISVQPGVALETASSADLHAAGSESNVAGALASLGHRVAWHSRLPDNPPGRLIANEIRRTGVDLSLLTWCDTGRVGSFYVELNAPPTPVRVTYDRADSCAVQISPDSIPWDDLLNTRLLHLTGITPALSTSCLAATARAIERAKKANVPVSFDVNFRRKLWSGEEARKALLPLVQNVALLFCGESDAAEVFDLTGSPESKLRGLAEMTQAERIVLSVGGEGTIAWDRGTLRKQSAYPTHVIDRLGAGDALAAGVIHGWLEGDFELGLRAGAALAGLALRRHGDLTICRKEELAELLAGSNARPNR